MRKDRNPGIYGEVRSLVVETKKKRARKRVLTYVADNALLVTGKHYNRCKKRVTVGEPPKNTGSTGRKRASRENIKNSRGLLEMELVTQRLFG